MRTKLESEPACILRALDCSTMPLTEPDLRARIRLFGLIDHSASESWRDACGTLSSTQRVLSETSRPMNQDGGYLPRGAINTISEMEGCARTGEFDNDPGIGAQDEIIHGLGQSLLPFLHRPSQAPPEQSAIHRRWLRPGRENDLNL